MWNKILGILPVLFALVIVLFSYITVKDIRAEIAEIKLSIQKLNEKAGILEQGSNAIFPIGQRPIRGNKNTRVVMLEFTDFQCPFCKKYHTEVFPALDALYVSTGKIQYMQVDFPLRGHPMAETAALAARCGIAEGKYFEMVDALFEMGTNFKDDDFNQAAAKFKLNPEQFRNCMQNKIHLDSVRSDVSNAEGINVSGTPTFLVGRVNSQGQVVGKVIYGSQPLTTFKQYIESALEGVDH